MSFGLAKKKPMHIFGGQWVRHSQKIKENWTATVTTADTVLIPGDISWAMTLDEFAADAAFLHSLPGKKIITGGNHDYWWGGTTRLNEMYPDLVFLKNTFSRYEDRHICGARGWVCPNDSSFTAHDLKIYKRETNRLALSLESAMADGAERIIVMLHFPPFNDKNEPSAFVETMKGYPVETVVYGHLHGERCRLAVRGERDGTAYHLVSADFVQFKPYRVAAD